jgi:hypothetical protein
MRILGEIRTAARTTADPSTPFAANNVANFAQDDSLLF